MSDSDYKNLVICSFEEYGIRKDGKQSSPFAKTDERELIWVGYDPRYGLLQL